MASFPGEPGLAGHPLNSPYPSIPGRRVPPGQAQTFHVTQHNPTRSPSGVPLSEMTYTVSSGMLNSTVPYHTSGVLSVQPPRHTMPDPVTITPSLNVSKTLQTTPSSHQTDQLQSQELSEFSTSNAVLIINITTVCELSSVCLWVSNIIS